MFLSMEKYKKTERIKNMKNVISGAYKQDVLILNKGCLSKNDSFYFELFRIPEVLNRLKQYREVLNENDINIPFWVYNLSENLKIHTEGGNKGRLLKFLTSLGLFDRYVSRSGWPKYIVGVDPLISVVLREISFEEQILLLTKGYCQVSSHLQLYEVFSYYNMKTGVFNLTKLKKIEAGYNIEDIAGYIKKNVDDNYDYFYQLLSPHSEDTMRDLRSKGIFPKDFLQVDNSLKWLWPIWKRDQISRLKQFSGNHYKSRSLS